MLEQLSMNCLPRFSQQLAVRKLAAIERQASRKLIFYNVQLASRSLFTNKPQSS